MAKERKRFSREFKIKVVQAYESGVSAVELSRQFEIHANVIYAWAREYRRDGADAFGSGESEQGSSKANEQRLVELERMVGRLAMENEFLKKALQNAKSILSKGNPGPTKP
jgi:transposase